MNPCLIPGAGVDQAAERPTATAAQVELLANVAGRRFQVMVLLASWRGLRLGEILGLQRAAHRHQGPNGPGVSSRGSSWRMGR
jgi:hypothetical protein